VRGDDGIGGLLKHQIRLCVLYSSDISYFVMNRTNDYDDGGGGGMTRK